jgi:predicted RNA polymerase sigma factor
VADPDRAQCRVGSGAAAAGWICYRDDVLRPRFTWCHPQLPATQQIALALCLFGASGAFLLHEAAQAALIRQHLDRLMTVI